MPKDRYYLPQRGLVSQNEASIIERSQVPRSKFNGAWTRKTAFNAGILVPILVDEILPGDHMTYRVTAYVRMATPLFPLFDNQRIDTFFFYVPSRILWDNWKLFMGEQSTPAQSIDKVIPQLVLTDAQNPLGSIFDHMGLPGIGQITAGQDISVNTLPFRAYNRIYNDWFRDENLIDSISVATGDGPDIEAYYRLRRRNKPHDYFTSALPWPQKFTAPNVPVAGLAPISGIGFADGATPNAGPGPGLMVWEPNKSTSQNWAYSHNNTDAAATVFFKAGGAGAPSGANLPQIFADLSQATGVAINTFRQAFLVQQLLERDARGGTRYVELLKSHFGVTSPDFRLQRPEYIGGGQSPLQLTPVAQTAPTAGVPVGALGAAGTGMGTHSASYAATEHGYIIGLINIRTELSYQQGIHKLWSRNTRYDFYWPALAGLGEQAILRKEIYALGTTVNDDAVFGYQERWHEYRTRQSEITGIMRSTAVATIDMWHLAQKFTTAPTLGQTFIEEDPPMARVLAQGTAADGQQYLADIMFQRTAVRPLPAFGTPVLLGRF